MSCQINEKKNYACHISSTDFSLETGLASRGIWDKAVWVWLQSETLNWVTPLAGQWGFKYNPQWVIRQRLKTTASRRPLLSFSRAKLLNPACPSERRRSYVVGSGGGDHMFLGLMEGNFFFSWNENGMDLVLGANKILKATLIFVQEGQEAKALLHILKLVGICRAARLWRRSFQYRAKYSSLASKAHLNKGLSEFWFCLLGFVNGYFTWHVTSATTFTDCEELVVQWAEGWRFKSLSLLAQHLEA